MWCTLLSSLYYRVGDVSKLKNQRGELQCPKLMVLFCYIMVLVIFNFATFSVTIYNAKYERHNLFDYFLCESTGVSSGKEKCINDSVDTANTIATLISLALLTFFPITCLIYAFNVTDVKEKFTYFCKCIVCRY